MFKKEFLKLSYNRPDLSLSLDSGVAAHKKQLFFNKREAREILPDFRSPRNGIKINNLLKNKSFLSFLSFIFLKNLVQFFNRLFILMYTFVIKCIDLLESFMFIIYKFLEKPAELMVEWIAQIFLVEWTADSTTYIPETVDIYTWNSLNKFSRHIRALGISGNGIQRIAL